MPQSTLSDISDTEGGSSDDEDENPGVTREWSSSLPRKFDHNREDDEDEDEGDDEEEPLDPMFRGPRRYGPCPICGELSPVSWRCVDCGKLFDDMTTKGGRRPTAVND